MEFPLVGDLSNSVAGQLTGLNLTTGVTNLYVAYERTVRILGNRIDIPEASGRQPYMLYSGVYDYAAPDSIFGGSVNNLRPQGIVSTPLDVNYKVPIAQFDQTKAFLPNGYMLTFEYQNGAGVMRVATPNVTPKIILDPCNAATGWIATGTASNLQVDTTVYYQQPAALRFALGTGIGMLTKTLTNSLSMSAYQGVGVAFIAIMIPQGTDPATLTGMSFKLGSDSTDYNEVTETEGFLGAWIAGEYLLVAFDFAAATTTGTPNWAAIQYLQVSLTASTAIVNMRVGYIFISLPQPHLLLFQSPAIFLPENAATPNTFITNDNDQVLLGPAAYNIYEVMCAKQVALQSSGGVYTDQIKGFDMELNGMGPDNPGLFQIYQADNPSEELRTVGTYYDGANY